MRVRHRPRLPQGKSRGRLPQRRTGPMAVSFAKTGAALLPATIATSRDLSAPMITMMGRPERCDGTYGRAHVSSSDAHGAADDLRQRVVRNDGVSRRLL